MASLVTCTAKHLRSISLLRGRSWAQALVAASGKRYMSQEKPISRFPVPAIDTLPKDMQDRMKEVEEKVSLIKMLACMRSRRINKIVNLGRKIL